MDKHFDKLNYLICKKIKTMRNKNSVKSRFLILSIWRHLSKNKKRRILFSLIIMILNGFAELITISSVIPFLTALLNPEKLFNHPISIYISEVLNITEVESMFIPVILTFGICVILSTILRLYNLHLNFDIAASIGADLSFKAYTNNLNQPFEFHLNNNSSKLISFATTYINQTVAAISNFFVFISNLILTIAISIGLFLINGKLAIYLLFVFTLIYIGLGKKLTNEVKLNSRIVVSSELSLVKSMQEVLGSIRDVLLNGNQKIYTNKLKDIEIEKRKKTARNQFIGEFPRYAIEGFALLVVAIISLSFIKESTQSASLIIFLGAFVLGIQRLLPSIQRVYSTFILLSGYNSDLIATLEMLELKYKKISSKIFPFNFKKSIKFKNVYFSYNKDESPIIKNLSIEIFKGEKIGIIGETGSGKSTFLDLLMGLLQPNSGRIIVDNKDIHDTNFPARINEWKLSISHVPQDVYLTDSSIAENIAFGTEKNLNCKKKIKEAATLSQLNEFIESKVNGYNTRVGEKGVQLSGGQKQRIGIARALYKNTEIIILDEATSALDNATEVKLVNNINKLSHQKTIIAIAHRKSSLKNFDRILKLEKGSIISQGSPDEML